MKIQRIDGALFEKMVRGGLANIALHEREINDMNVFPVPDGDTGYNMRQTLENGISHAESDKHLGNYLKQLSKGMLLGARGNSGVILSQLFRGFAEELERDSLADAGEIKSALIAAYKTAYSAVAHPVEGTVLTVAREGIENVCSQIRRGTTADMVFSMYLAEMRKSVRHTPEILRTLKDAGVLDSGAVGYIAIVDGMTRTMFGEEIALRTTGEKSATTMPAALPQTDADDNFDYGYCMEFLLQLQNRKQPVSKFDRDAFVSELQKNGNSVVAIVNDGIVKVHVHTFVPEVIMAYAHGFGEFISFKLDNMQLQSKQFEQRVGQKQVAATTVENVYAAPVNSAPIRHKSMAIVAVADGDGVTEILRGCGADVVIKGGATMNTPSEEFVKAFKILDADKIVVLPNNENIVSSAAQAAEICGISDKTEIIPTASVLEGYYALAMGTSDIEDTCERIAAMKDGASGIVTVCVAKAVKSYSDGTFSCKAGQYIGFIGKKLVSADDEMITALEKAIAATPDLDEKSSMIILNGAKITDERQSKIDERLEKRFSDLSRDFLYGGQSAYDVIVGIV